MTQEPMLWRDMTPEEKGALLLTPMGDVPMSDTGRLVFMNADATPKNTFVECTAQSVPQIMAWYGAYFVGDRYTVSFDGRNISMDQNGEPKQKLKGQNNE